MSLKFNSKIVATLKEMNFMKFWFVFGLIWSVTMIAIIIKISIIHINNINSWMGTIYPQMCASNHSPSFSETNKLFGQRNIGNFG